MGLSLNGADPNLSLNGARPNLSLDGSDPRAPAGPNSPPTPTILVTPDHALSTVDLGQQGASGARFTWDPGTGATAVRVELPDGPITDLARRSHIVRSFDLENGHYRDSTGTIVSTNAAGDSDPVAATLLRWRPASIAVGVGGSRQVQAGGIVLTQFALDFAIGGRPFPQVISIAPSGHQGAITSHQLARYMSYAPEDASFVRRRRIIFERVATIRESVTYTVMATNYFGGERQPDGSWAGGTQLSNPTHAFTLGW